MAALDDAELFNTPEDDDRFPVHNDWAYYKHNDYPPAIVSSAITIDACREETAPSRCFRAAMHGMWNTCACATAWKCHPVV